MADLRIQRENYGPVLLGSAQPDDGMIWWRCAIEAADCGTPVVWAKVRAATRDGARSVFREWLRAVAAQSDVHCREYALR